MIESEFETILEQYDGNLWGTYIEIPDDVVDLFPQKTVIRVLCHINGSEPFHAGMMSKGEGRKFITLNKAFCKKHKIAAGDRLAVKLVEDTSEYGMEMPIELREIMNQEPDVHKHFHGLTPGKQRNLLHLINSVKSENIKLRRAWVISTHLLSEKGKIDFKKLYNEIKDANQRENRG